MRDRGVGPYRDDMGAARTTTEWMRSRPLVTDTIFASVLMAFAIIAGIATEPSGSERHVGVLGWFLIIFATAPIAVRRKFPLSAMWVVLGGTIPFWVLDYPDDPVGVGLLITIYSVGAHVARPTSLRHAVVAVCAIVVVGTIGVLIPSEDLPWFAIPAFIVMHGTAFVLGDNLRTRRAYLRQLETTAERVEAQTRAEAQSAVSEERTRIARDLHDVVAHSMSVMVVQAGAARRVIDTNPKMAAEALGAIETTGRESLDEMRRILGVLRSEGDELELAPAPGLGDFSRLVDQCETAGMSVDVVFEGEAKPLSASLELSAYRIVQESLTNSLKHAGPARATVCLTYGAQELIVRVTDNGRGASVKAVGAGQGLIGMRERAEAFGGSLTAGPRTGGGYAVSAILPIVEHR